MKMDINAIVSKIIKEKIPCYFISPHLDDAVFSAGNLLLRLVSKTSITLITVFTEGSSFPYTLSAKVFLKKCGYKNALDLFKDRRTEDLAVCGELKAKSVHLGMVDASFRKKNSESYGVKFIGSLVPELTHVYPIYRLHIVSGKISREDKAVLSEVEAKLRAFSEIKKGGFVFCPIGIGRHVDHIIVRDVCQKLFPRLICWEDFPYNLEKKKKADDISKISLGLLDISGAGNGKIKLMSFYKSQIKPMFPYGINLLPESYFAIEDSPAIHKRKI